MNAHLPDILYVLNFNIEEVRLCTKESRCYVQTSLDDMYNDGKFCKSEICVSRMFFEHHEKFLPFTLKVLKSIKVFILVFSYGCPSCIPDWREDYFSISV